MSRLAKKPIPIPPGVTATLGDGQITIKGPAGEVVRALNRRIKVESEGNAIKVSPLRTDALTRAMLGTYAAHIKNMMIGATQGFEKKLVVEGIGYRANLAGDKLVLNLGFSHPVEMKVPAGLKVAVEKEFLSIKGANIEQVGEFAASVRAKRKPDAYKEKGIRYHDEVIKRKQGKKAVT